MDGASVRFGGKSGNAAGAKMLIEESDYPLSAGPKKR